MIKKILSIFRRLGDRIMRLWKREGTLKNFFAITAEIFIEILVLIGIFFGTVLWSIMSNRPSITPSVSSFVVSSLPRHPLTGEVLSDSLSRLPRVFGVMVENSADAWPLSGLDEAFLVIEAPVEGNIPRFIAFYSEETYVAKIGPVRSARPYYLDWNAEFQGIYGHVGGSPEALDDIAKNGTLDLNQFFQSEYYYRDEKTRYAPHNVYTNSYLLLESIEEMRKKYSTSSPSYDSWIFVDGVSQSSSSDTTHLAWGNGYDIDWMYDPSTNTYHRLQGGNTYTANNVVIIATDIGTIPGDEKGRRTVRTIGEGLVMILKNGTQNTTPWTWKKTSASDRMRFYDEQGKEVLMNVGKTWIEVTDDLGEVATH